MLLDTPDTCTAHAYYFDPVTSINILFDRSFVLTQPSSKSQKEYPDEYVFRWFVC